MPDDGSACAVAYIYLFRRDFIKLRNINNGIRQKGVLYTLSIKFQLNENLRVMKDEFDAVLNENPDSLVVIDFYATWCGPCKIMGPKFIKLSNEFTSVVFVKVDVDESEDIVSRFDIKVMPTFIFMRKGAQIDMVEGSVEDDLRKKIEQHK
ncbi:putative thioredoxin [Ancylostoma ceylanicum]|uniref:Putative thioredoxin n=1 Tax=Ancylostoma ceylanicum TaxID=53326 RepID=A0A0D6M4H6_9BILA|nr:putative thioredoxin [Ancylostoma ceylanicum]